MRLSLRKLSNFATLRGRFAACATSSRTLRYILPSLILLFSVPRRASSERVGFPRCTPSRPRASLQYPRVPWYWLYITIILGRRPSDTSGSLWCYVSSLTVLCTPLAMVHFPRAILPPLGPENVSYRDDAPRVPRFVISNFDRTLVANRLVRKIAVAR